jgi:hypothetical protein
MGRRSDTGDTWRETEQSCAEINEGASAVSVQRLMENCDEAAHSLVAINGW